MPRSPPTAAPTVRIAAAVQSPSTAASRSACPLILRIEQRDRDIARVDEQNARYAAAPLSLSRNLVAETNFGLRRTGETASLRTEWNLHSLAQPIPQ